MVLHRDAELNGAHWPKDVHLLLPSQTFAGREENLSFQVGFVVEAVELPRRRQQAQ